MLASDESLEQLGIVARQRIEVCATTARGIVLGRGHTVQIAFGVGGIFDRGPSTKLRTGNDLERAAAVRTVLDVDGEGASFILHLLQWDCPWPVE